MLLLEVCKENMLTQHWELETMKTVTPQQNSIGRYKIRERKKVQVEPRLELLRRVEMTWEACTHPSATRHPCLILNVYDPQAAAPSIGWGLN